MKAKEYALKYACRFTDINSAADAMGYIAEELWEEAKQINRQRFHQDQSVSASVFREMLDKSVAIAKQINVVAGKNVIHLYWLEDVLPADITKIMARDRMVSRMVKAHTEHYESKIPQEELDKLRK